MSYYLTQTKLRPDVGQKLYFQQCLGLRLIASRGVLGFFSSGFIVGEAAQCATNTDYGSPAGVAEDLPSGQGGGNGTLYRASGSPTTVP